MAADEPRRSGRATKGQHKNLDTGDETPKPKKSAAAAAAATTTTSSTPNNNNNNNTPVNASSKKSAKKSAEPEAEPEEDGQGSGADDDDGDDDGGDDEVVRCICGATGDKGLLTQYVSCDECEVWQHNICMGLPIVEKELPDHYFCEECHPEDHAELLAAMARGETPWEDRLRAYRNAKKRGKRKSAATRKSAVNELKSDAASEAVTPSPAPATSASQDSGVKRKFEEEEEEEEEHSQPPSQPEPSIAQDSPVPVSVSVPAPTPTPAPAPISTPVQDAASPTESKRAEKRRKSSAPAPATATATATATAAAMAVAAADGKDADPETALVDIEQLPQERKKPAEALSKVISDHVNSSSKSGKYRIPDGHTATSLGKHHAVRVEYALYMNHGPFTQGRPTEAYSHQFRALIPNMKRNQMLIERLLHDSLTADELATMKPEDMASEEEQKKRAAMKEEVEKQSVMIQEDERPRVRRTHKGDEYVDDEGQQTEQSVFTSQPVRRREPDSESGAVSPTVAQPGATTASPDRMDIDKPDKVQTTAAAHDRRTSSQQFDISNVWAKTHQSPTDEQPQARLLQQPARRRSSIQKQTQQEKGEKFDADVDRLLADEDDPDDEYTPADAVPRDSSVIWHGELIQPGVTHLKVNARFVAGNDFGRYISWSDFLPSKLEIEGRLEAKRADDYLCGLQWSKKSDVAVVALTPDTDRSRFDHIFDYFATRSRYAVIKKGHGMSDIVKDVYITPAKPDSDLPPHINLLEHTTLDYPLTERLLLMTFVVNKPAHWDNPAAAPIPAEAAAAASAASNTNGNGLPQHVRNGPLASPLTSQPYSGPAFSPRPEQGFTPQQSHQNGTNFAHGGAPSALPLNPYAIPMAPTPPDLQQQQQQQQLQHLQHQQHLQQQQQQQQQQPFSYPAPQSNHHAQGQQPLQQSHLNPMIQRILGPLATAPTVQHILAAAGGQVQENMLHGMKTILTSDPGAADDIVRFTQHLGMIPRS